MKAWTRAQDWNVDIDRYINPYLPRSQLHRLPTPISRFLGYRTKQHQDVGNVLGAIWSFLGAFCGLAVIAAIFNNSPEIQARHPPAMIASFVCSLPACSCALPFRPYMYKLSNVHMITPTKQLMIPQGASAILEYNAIRAPLGQPRAALLGHTFSALVGVSITKAFRTHYTTPESFARVRWLAGAVNCGAASVVMLLTGTVHPPGGASAVLAATEPEITDMGWYFVALVMLGTVLLLAVGLVTNNIQRQFPVYWWTPLEVGRGRGRFKKEEEALPDGTGGFEKKDGQGESGKEDGHGNGNGKLSLERQFTEDIGMVGGKRTTQGIHISSNEIFLPEDLSLNGEEVALLEGLRDRLKARRIDEADEGMSSSSSTVCTVEQRQLEGPRSHSDASSFCP
jgi:hypothetical protein